MTENESKAVLAVLCAAWPRYELTGPTIGLWARQLEHTLPEDALAAAELLVKTDDRFPSLARFIETCRAEARRRGGGAGVPALPPDTNPILTGGAAKAALAQVRETLAAAPKPPHIDGVQSVGETLSKEYT